MRKRRNHEAGLQRSRGAGGRERRAYLVGVGHRIWRASDDDPPVEKALLDGAADIFERGTKKTAEVNEDTVRALHAKIGELALASDFFITKA